MEHRRADALTVKRLAHYQTQVRAKYTEAEIEELGKKGQAFKDADGSYSYPIADTEDLSNAIRAVGRGNADHDAIRRYIIARAKDLGKSDEIPDNWSSDGSLSDDKTADMSAEQRATYQDTYDALSSAIAAKFESDDKDEYDWSYLVDFSDEWAVFYQKDQKFQVPYSMDGNTVTLGKASPVREVTTYVPLESKSGGHPATPKRAFSSLIEQPPAHTAELQVRMEETGDPNTAQFVGYASTTGEAYSVRDWLGEYQETIMPGAFAKTLREQPAIPLLFNHDGLPLASTGSGTSRLSEDARGLRNEAVLDRRQALANDLCIALERRDVDKMSFSFRAIKDTWNDNYDDRQVSELACYDTSIVTYPANPGTTAELQDAMRSALGREGVGIMWSVRTALPQFIETRELPEPAGDVVEQALKALTEADERLCRQFGRHGRARTFLVARAMLEVRQGKVLSSANEELLRSALTALSNADSALSKVDDALDEGQGAISTVLGVANPDTDDSEDGKDHNQGPGNSVLPQDGAGPRSASLKLKRQREAELRALRGR